MTELLAATLNIRNIADRWPERLPLLLADMTALQPDVMGLQEVVFAVGQDRLLGAAGEARYRVSRGWAGRPEYGNAILAREGRAQAASDASRLDLGRNRSALRLGLELQDGGHLAFVVTHLHHAVPDEAIRQEQARRLVKWLVETPGPAAQ
ncbi:MAG TPA: endonuclease/exonuclease/phosphatase family protein, partial [Candidatus Binatus sp.]|nr:endonuclease/exonuclease/phosphatase family protein [Candidatus Binatus sp.]